MNTVAVKLLALETARLGVKVVLRPVLLLDGAEATLVDSGYPCHLDEFSALLAAAGTAADRLTRIIVTHQDWDHIGLVSELAAANRGRLEVLAHAEEKPYLEGALPYLKTTPERVAARLATIPAACLDDAAAMFAAIPTFAVTRTVADGELLPYSGGIRVIHTPGHTPGHIALYVEKERLLIPGDVLRVDNGRLVGPAPEFTPDMPAALRSLKKFLAYDIEQVMCFHGGLYTGDIRERIRELAEG